MLDIEYKLYDYLTIDSKNIRTKVFVNEQGFCEEFDSIDNNCIHILALVSGKGIATARLFKENGDYKIGRVCVLKEYRFHHIASEMLNILESKALELGANRIILGSQIQSKDFYKKNGYIECGDIYLDQSCPHIKMTKYLG